MRFLNRSSRAARAAVTAAVVLLPLKAAGCAGSSACINVPQATYDAHGCPSRSTANTFFESSCAVQSVDGEGSYDGAFCCYPVTDTGNGVDCAGAPGEFGDTGTTGVSGTGGFSGTSAVSSGGFGAAGTGGTVVFDAGAACATCAAILSNGQGPIPPCPESGGILMDLIGCGCSSCPMQCAASLCGPSMNVDKPCGECLQTSCSSALAICDGD